MIPHRIGIATVHGNRVTMKVNQLLMSMVHMFLNRNLKKMNLNLLVSLLNKIIIYENKIQTTSVVIFNHNHDINYCFFRALTPGRLR